MTGNIVDKRLLAIFSKNNEQQKIQSEIRRIKEIYAMNKRFNQPEKNPTKIKKLMKSIVDSQKNRDEVPKKVHFKSDENIDYKDLEKRLLLND